MTASSRGGRVLRGTVLSSSNLCSRCATSYARTPARFYSAAAEPAAASPTSGVSSSTNPPPPLAAHPSPAYDIRSGLILTRAPLLTRRLHPFESAFFFYQKRLEERLNNAFIPSIYFKPDTPRRMEWDLKIGERQGTVAKELGVYNGKSSTAWQDELKVGDPLSSEEHLLKSLLKDAEVRVSEDAELIPEEDVVPVELPGGRETEADRTGDVRRLDRQLDRTLYLVVKGKDGWGFPADVVPPGENLHECAQRVIDQAAGVNMNIWIVGRVPVAHLVQRPVQKDDGSVEKKGEKTFFLKGRIMAGQADLKDNPFGYTDFKWLTREELEKELAPEYFRGVRNMMSNR
ncbi:54S ribosomal protein-like protein [Hapsidospora chrysogenum ATCC 11550]|uniref:Large ribosomal subunit protein mL46 n=1 Tax=Hapsidospora chrysogenum (strain ATCC 11550 / CBS 779.69 / DSM 880 / IAM 14645 / JCM 23072 / IMI 49137) TaxID=857340 RepID=A0A086TI07_HAPC1|nr:54S ribosomal protein-like protein [Hapsidospora chrysogenum ATCC 11550]